MSENKKGTLGTTIGYGLGSMVRTGENLWGFYLSFFLVTVAGVNAAVAGTISGAALLIASIWCIFIGYISDNSKNKNGKRRPIMLFSIFPTVILMSLIFVKVDFGGATTVYYAVVCILFYIIYYTYLVPYDSLGAELTVDYNSRTKIRSLCTAILYVSVFVGGTLVMIVEQIFEGTGTASAAGSWTLAVAISCSLPMLICGLIAWRATKGKEPTGAEITEQPKGENIVSSYLSVLKVKPFLGITLWAIFYFIANTVLAGMLIYFGVYVLGLSQTSASSYFTIMMVITIVWAAPAGWISQKLGKRNTLFLAMFLFAIGGLIVFLKGPSGYVDGLIVSILGGIANSTALIVSYSMVYDVGELNEFKTGDSKVAACVGAYTFGMGLAQAIANYLNGQILVHIGFDATAAVQSASTIAGLTKTCCLLPLVFLAAATLVVMLLYKITPKNYAALCEALEAKREGKEYSTEGFKELL